MYRFFHWTVGGVVGALLSMAASAATPTLSDTLALESFVDGVVQPLMLINNAPSGSVVIAHQGRIVLAKGYGFEDVELRVPVDASTTLFRPGSVSKLFTWVAVMQLVEQGKLDLDTDVNTYLKTFEIADSYDEPVTLRHAMTHTAGFEDGGIGYLVKNDPAEVLPLAESLAKYQPARVNPPGVQTSYSNYATALAGLIVANIAGVPFERYIEQFIFTPLGMNSSSFDEPLPEALDDNMAAGYKLEAGAFVEKPFEIVFGFGPAGGASSTATDMVRFSQAMLNGGELDGARILQEATVKEMLTLQFSQDERLPGMGLGFYQSEYNGHTVMGHGGDLQWFHSQLGFDQANDLVFFVSFGGAGGGSVRSAFSSALYNQYFPSKALPPVAPEGFTERAAKYAGSYSFWRHSFSKFERILVLAGGITITPSADDSLIVSAGGASKQYVEIGKNLFQEANPSIDLPATLSAKRLAFQEGDSGTIHGLIFDSMPFMSAYRQPFYETSQFNFALLGLSLVILLATILRRFFQRQLLQSFSPAERSSINVAVFAAVAHFVALIVGVMALTAVMKAPFDGLPTLFTVWLWLPLLAALLSVLLFYRGVVVWRDGQFSGVMARVRFTFIVASGLFLVWFYYYWKILGFNYYS